MQEFKALILGNVSVWYYLAAEFFAVLAIILSLYVGSSKRNINSSATPVSFSHAFLFWDNAKRIAVGQIVLFLLFRFITELTGKQLTMWWAVGIGFFVSLGVDRAIAFLKTFSPSLQMDRQKIMDKLPASVVNGENKNESVGADINKA